MTADPYVRDQAGRFAPTLLRDVPPIPEPRRVPDSLEPTADNPVVEVRPGHFRVYAPKCQHGSFLHWAARNCCKETYRAR